MQCIERSVQAFHPSFFLAVEMEPLQRSGAQKKQFFAVFLPFVRYSLAWIMVVRPAWGWAIWNP